MEKALLYICEIRVKLVQGNPGFHGLQIIRDPLRRSLPTVVHWRPRAASVVRAAAEASWWRAGRCVVLTQSHICGSPFLHPPPSQDTRQRSQNIAYHTNFTTVFYDTRLFGYWDAREIWFGWIRFGFGFDFWRKSHNVAQTGLKLVILLPHLLKN